MRTTGYVRSAAIDWDPRVGEPLIGWRAWRAVDRQGSTVLESITFRVRWPRRRPFRAHCAGHWQKGGPSLSPLLRARGMHCAPAEAGRGECGVYAVKDRLGVESWLPTVGSDAIKVGRVALWGRVVRHEGGFRAE